MSDLISRSRLIEEMKNDLALKYTGDVTVNFINGMIARQNEIIDIINDMPSVDAVPVVRCKECKQWNKDIGWCDKHSHFINSDGSFCYPWESNDWKMFNENDFCSDGERVKDECVCKKERH